MGYPINYLHTNQQLTIEANFNHFNAIGKDFSRLRDLEVLQPGGAPFSQYMAGRLAGGGGNVK